MCYTDSFSVHVKTDDIYKYIADVEIRFDTWYFELDRQLPKGKNKKNKNWTNDWWMSWTNH